MHAVGTEYLKSKDSDGVKDAFIRFQRIYSKYLPDGKVTEWHTDFGGEFSSKSLDDFCEEICTKRSYSLPDYHTYQTPMPKLNGLVLGFIVTTPIQNGRQRAAAHEHSMLGD